ncbi:MAG: DUF2075 domain-containing protein [Lachnospiraceae bacterium]|nr:DUF2075 domain-containing protein [Lachnospiraceae bacterium]
MYPINIYALTRMHEEKQLQRLERQLSGRRSLLKIKEWEIDSLKQMCEHLCAVKKEAAGLKFFYSFTMPKLGKEFDLLRVCEGSVINVELKSGPVTEEAVLHQLLQNKYYLATLGKSTYFYTYISQTDTLVRLTGSERLVKADWEELLTALEHQQECYEGPIEELFKEEEYLISPLTDPGRFLRREYFLTSQQRDIKTHILRHILTSTGSIAPAFSITGFTGLPGTGKSLLLYDLAMQLSKKETVCVLHIGAYEKALRQLDERLKRVDFYHCDVQKPPELTKRYAAILIDEGHRLTERLYAQILKLARQWQVPVIATFDKEDAIPSREGVISGSRLIMETEGYTGYKLTNRIRLNSELSSFIASLMRCRGRGKRSSYPSVTLLYANDESESAALLSAWRDEGYVYIQKSGESAETHIGIAEAVCKEYDRVMMKMDAAFFYDEDGYLREGERSGQGDGGSGVSDLFHGLSRAKKRIAVIVENNPAVFDALLGVLQEDWT